MHPPRRKHRQGRHALSRSGDDRGHEQTRQVTASLPEADPAVSRHLYPHPAERRAADRVSPPCGSRRGPWERALKQSCDAEMDAYVNQTPVLATILLAAIAIPYPQLVHGGGD